MSGPSAQVDVDPSPDRRFSISEEDLWDLVAVCMDTLRIRGIPLSLSHDARSQLALKVVGDYQEANGKDAIPRRVSSRVCWKKDLDASR